MFGILNIHKPAGWTSRDVVNQVQRLVRPHKAGHAGTLDPLATGVLVVCVGAATRLIEYVQAQHKRYRGAFLLGRESDTEDVTGDVRELASTPVPSLAQIQSVLPQFTGTILQRPPAYSALKVQGKRAYELARKGQEVELAPRPIEVFSIDVVSYSYPELVLDIHCGSGTYVRSLGRDIAESLGTAAVMSALERTSIGVFEIGKSVAVEGITLDCVRANLLSPLTAVAQLPVITLTDDEELRLIQGKRITKPSDSAATEFATVNAAGRLVGVVQVTVEGDLRSVRVFPPTANMATPVVE